MLHPHLELLPSAISRLRKVVKIFSTEGVEFKKFQNFLDHRFDVIKMNSEGYVFGYAHCAASHHMEVRCLLFSQSIYADEEIRVNPMFVQTEMGFYAEDEKTLASSFLVRYDILNDTWDAMYSNEHENSMLVPEPELGIEFTTSINFGNSLRLIVNATTAYQIVRFMAQFFASHAN
ncbi:MAG: hypothetical protein P1P90_05500 [Patescibacteria group bacterium]|nr:hypothetical protein [Patescibacteria group bacterium]